MTNTTKSTPNNVLTTLRGEMPLRPLSFWEHKTIVEKQADRLLSLLGQSEPAFDLMWLTEQERIEVVLVPQWRMDSLSGMTTWQDGRWLIAVNKGNPLTRRRFTLLHEFKHALDANRDSITYKNLDDRQREQIADYFAACALMPKAWVRRVWTRGIQDPEALAGLFRVSRPAIDKRLRALGFVDADPERSLASYFRTSSSPDARRGDLAA